MEISYRKQLKDNRPYWKVIVSLVFSLLATALFIWLGYKAMIYFLPFVIGWFIAYLASPVVSWIEKRLQIKRKIGSAAVIVLVLAVVCGLLYLLGKEVVGEVSYLFRNLPELYGSFETGMHNIVHNMEGIISMFPESVVAGGSELAVSFESAAGKLMEQLSEPTVAAAGRIARKIPGILIGVIVTILSAYFMVADREKLIEWSRKVTPDPILKRVSMAIYNLKHSVGGYFKAQFKIMMVIWGILVIGFMILGIPFNLLLSVIIAFFDFLPFFGTGTVFVPWLLYEVMTADYKMALGLLILYPVTQIVHRTIEPKLLGDCVGLNPLLTLVLIYVGYKIGSVLGMVFAVPVGTIVINMHKAGAFDYILDDIKILTEGILSLRKK